MWKETTKLKSLHTLQDCDVEVIDAMSFGGDSSVAFVSPDQYQRDPNNFRVNHVDALSCELTRFRVPLGELSV